MSEDNYGLNKELIISAAATAFARYGFKKTTLDDIASLTNKGKTAIYYYFKNKEEIFEELIRKEASNMEKVLLEVVEKEKEPIGKFKAYIVARMAFLEKISMYYHAMKSELLEQLAFINLSRQEFDTVELQIVLDILEEGRQLGVFKIEDVWQTASVLILTLKSLEIPFFGSPEPFDYKLVLKRLSDILLHGIARPL